MMEYNEFTYLTSTYGPMVLLMFSTFILGYFSSLVLHARTTAKKIKKLREEVNRAKLQAQKVTSIDTIFTEIKPKIVDIVKEAQLLQETELPKEEVLKNAKTTYLNYTKTAPLIDFATIGEGSKKTANELTKIEGIGPYVEQRLNEIGIFTFEQISKLQLKDIKTVTELIEFFPGRIQRDNWVSQAEDLMKFQKSK